MPDYAELLDRGDVEGMYAQTAADEALRDLEELEREIAAHRQMLGILSRARNRLLLSMQRKRPSDLMNTLGLNEFGGPKTLEHGVTAFTEGAVALNPAIDGSHEQPHTHEANHEEA